MRIKRTNPSAEGAKKTKICKYKDRNGGFYIRKT